jgi:hypothetical protein
VAHYIRCFEELFQLGRVDFTLQHFASRKSLDPEVIQRILGGASKKPKQADWLIRDDIEYPTKKAIPLWSLGMMDLVPNATH